MGRRGGGSRGPYEREQRGGDSALVGFDFVEGVRFPVLSPARSVAAEGLGIGVGVRDIEDRASTATSRHP
ncbi:hypothetical protein [Streptomyces sioyaensis]|uniref:hypothetical protein n=1 Tax=Streptomyces sioyaensis TaxID=67364 RepID=UPI00371D7270